MLRQGDFPGLSDRISVITGVLLRGTQELQIKGSKGRCYAAGTEAGGRAQEPRRRGGETNSSISTSTRNAAPLTPSF